MGDEPDKNDVTVEEHSGLPGDTSGVLSSVTEAITGDHSDRYWEAQDEGKTTEPGYGSTPEEAQKDWEDKNTK